MKINIERHKSESYLTKKDREGFCQVKLTKRKIAPHAASGITLVYSHEELKQLRDAIDVYLAHLPKPHPHAELMALYAEDAKETDEPWERWQYKTPAEFPRFTRRYYDEDGYTNCTNHPAWDLRYQYRRKSSV